MRVLWFTNTPSNYLEGTTICGGWISSLEAEMLNLQDIDLGIAFLLNGHPPKVERNGTSYYPINNPYRGSLLRRLRYIITSTDRRRHYFMKKYLKVIDDFQPDIINIFGTEQDYGLIAQYTKVPIVIHIQGLLISCLSTFFTPGYSLWKYILLDMFPWRMFRRWRSYAYFKKNAETEKLIFKCNRHFMGRTQWDRNLTSIYNPQATYDYCGEILRTTFYESCPRKLPEKLIITTTISNMLYKGLDVVLKCAKLLKQQMLLDFEWRVYGNIDSKLIEKSENIKAQNVNVRIMGVASQEKLKLSIVESTLYVHPSYIENSPNSVCEAQMLGCTVVAQNVGGIPSIVAHGETGILVPANDPYQMACAIRDLYNDPVRNEEMGHRAAEIAHQRHDKERIVADLLGIYKRYMIEKTKNE